MPNDKPEEAPWPSVLPIALLCIDVSALEVVSAWLVVSALLTVSASERVWLPNVPHPSVRTEDSPSLIVLEWLAVSAWLLDTAWLVDSAWPDVFDCEDMLD